MTKIEWADVTWNPITGCSEVSDGCLNCYARRFAETRLRGKFGYDADDPFKVTYHRDRLALPSKWRKPRRIFVNSMGDLFHEDVPDKWINDVFDMMTHPMSGANHHTYMILTKRPERIPESSYERFSKWKNLWLGVTVESSKYLYRIGTLLRIPASVRFMSVEPCLSEIDLSWRRPAGIPGTRQLQWVICGAETGPGRRLMNLDWARSLRYQCRVTGIPFFFKKDSQGNHALDGKVHEEFPFKESVEKDKMKNGNIIGHFRRVGF